MLEVLQYLPKIESGKMSCDPHLDDRVERLENALQTLGIVLPAFTKPPKPVAPHNIIFPDPKDIDTELRKLANKILYTGIFLDFGSFILHFFITDPFWQNSLIAVGFVGAILMLFGGLGRPPRRKRRL